MFANVFLVGSHLWTDCAPHQALPDRTMETRALKITIGSSKIDFISDLISDKLTAAAREIFAELVKTVAEYENEVCTYKRELERRIWMKPDPETGAVDPEVFAEEEPVGGAEGGGASAEEEHQNSLRVVDSWSMSTPTFTEEEKERDKHLEEEEQDEVIEGHSEESLRFIPPGGQSDYRHAESLHSEEHVDLQIRILKHARLKTIAKHILERYPVHTLRCSRSLQGEEFLNFIKSKFAHLASDTPFDVVRAKKRPKMSSYSLKTLNPKDTIRTFWKDFICLRPKQKKKKQITEDPTRVASVEDSSDGGPEEAQPQDENQVNIRIRILEDPTIRFLSKNVFKRFPVQVLQCSRSLQEEEFLSLLRSTFPQLAPDRPIKVWRNSARKLRPIKLKSLTPQAICRLFQNNPLCIRLMSPLKVQDEEKSVQKTNEDRQNTEVYTQTPVKTENAVHLKICVLEEPRSHLETPEESRVIHQLDCPGDLQEALFLDLLRSSFPQLNNQTVELLVRNGDQLLPIKMQHQTVRDISQNIVSSEDSVLYVRVQDGSRDQSRVEHPTEQPLRDSLAVDPSEDNQVELKICILEDQEALGFSEETLLSHPTYALQCSRFLPEEEFLKFLRSTFPQLAPETPFKVYKISNDKMLQPLQVQTLTPEEVCRLSGAATICIRLQDPMKIQDKEIKSEYDEDEDLGVTAHRNSADVWTSRQSSAKDERNGQDPACVCSLHSSKLTDILVKNDMSWKDDISREAESGADLSRCFQLSCKVCRRSHQSVCTLIKHAWGHTYEDVGTCGVCGEHTASTEELKTHFLSHETSHTCTVCGQFFITASGFKTHMTQHSAPRMHCSGTCHRDLRTKLVLTNHMKLHQKKESLQGGSKGQASVSQPGVTVQPNDRKDQRLQRQSRKSSCTTSGKRQKSQKQTKINQLKCSKCNRMFWSKIQLEKHMMVHTGVEPHTCDVCGARFHYRVSMKKHLLTHKAGKFGL